MLNIKLSLGKCLHDLEAGNEAKGKIRLLLDEVAKKHNYDFTSDSFVKDLEYLGLTKAKFYEFYGSPNFGPKTSKGNDAWGPVDGE